jgi:outer membrane immunogenic protein
VGAGIEYAFSGPWSAKLEYDYVGLGTRNLTFVSVAPPFKFTEDVRQNLQEVKFGINYRFGGFGGPLVTKY